MQLEPTIQLWGLFDTAEVNLNCNHCVVCGEEIRRNAQKGQEWCGMVAPIPYGVVGEHTRLSRGRPGFNSRWGSFSLFFSLVSHSTQAVCLFFYFLLISLCVMMRMRTTTCVFFYHTHAHTMSIFILFFLVFGPSSLSPPINDY